MNCTLYNDPRFTYNAPINYNGVCVQPVTPTTGGGGMIAGYEPRPVVAFPKQLEEEAVALVLAELLLDD